MNEQSILNGSTLVPVGVIVVLAGGVVWLTNLHADTEKNTETLLRIEKKQDNIEAGIYEELKSINTRLSTIEGQLKKRE